MARKPQKFDYDLIVIGSGAGGSVAAHQLARAGKRVAIVEADMIGGECPNIGCVPTKALLHAAEIYESVKNGNRFGIRGSTVGYNYPTIKLWKDLAVKRTGTSLGETIYHEENINFIRGRAHFIDKNTITIGETRFTAHNYLIATGSELFVPDIPGLKKAGYITYREAINLTRPPRSILILGGGAIGCEFAQLFAIFNASVHIAEMSKTLLSREDPEAGTFLAKRFKDTYDIAVHTETQVISVETFGSKKRVLLRGNKDQKPRELMVDEILVATGKRAVVDIGLANAGIDHEFGTITVNKYMQTTASNIYAAGDCVGPYQFTHTATYQSKIVAYNLTHSRNKRIADYHAVPRCIFTNPEVAMVGMTEADLLSHAVEYEVAQVNLSVIGRSNTADFTDGFAKVMAAKKTGVILGATIAAPHAGEIIHELALAVQVGLTAQQVAETIHAFPTWSEIVRVACHKLASKI